MMQLKYLLIGMVFWDKQNNIFMELIIHLGSTEETYDCIIIIIVINVIKHTTRKTNVFK